MNGQYSDVVLNLLEASQTCVLPLWRVRAELALPLAVSRVHHRRFARVRPRGCAVGIPWEVLHVGGLTGHVAHDDVYARGTSRQHCAGGRIALGVS